MCIYLLQVTRGEMFYSPLNVSQALDTRYVQHVPTSVNSLTLPSLNLFFFPFLPLLPLLLSLFLHAYTNVSHRDALAKALYARLFTWLVARINDITHHQGQHSSVAVLDIFGFEVHMHVLVLITITLSDLPCRISVKTRY